MWLAFLETGGRWGELTQATWGDFDERRMTLTFRAATTKSKRERTLPIRESLVRELLFLKREHHRLRGRIPRASEIILLTPRGASWYRNRANAARRYFYRLLKIAEIPRVDEQGRKIDIHALRHTFGTRLARAGVDLIHAQKLMGHSDPKLTASIYTHLAAEDLQESVAKLPEPFGDRLSGTKLALGSDIGSAEEMHDGIKEDGSPSIRKNFRPRRSGSGGGTRTPDSRIMIPQL